MSRISSITLIEQPEQHVLTIRATIDFMNEFSDFCSQSFGGITEYLGRIGELFGDAPFVCFHNMDLEHLDVEVGFPVAKPINGNVDIKANTIPVQKVVSAIDLGPYEKQDPTLEEIFAWIQSNGYEMQGKIYYQYLNDTERPESEYLTKMVIPIK